MLNYDALLINKAEALIHLAKGSGKRCPGGTYIQRDLTNRLLVGKSAGSKDLKKLCPYLSEQADMLRTSLSFDEFHSKTTNDHQEPLIQMWHWLCDRLDPITPQEVLDRLARYPLVIITNQENQRLRQLGFNRKGDPVERYKEAEIKIIRR